MDFILLLLALSIILVVVGLFTKKRKPKKKNYYLKRFLRNKDQALLQIDQVQTIMVQHDAAQKCVFADQEITFGTYLEQLKTNFESEYTAEALNILKKQKLTHAKKQFFAKKLVNQSAELYRIETEIDTIKQLWQLQVSYT